MIEYQGVYASHNGGLLKQGLGGTNAGPVSLSICLACGVLVADEKAHTRNHQTPVVG